MKRRQILGAIIDESQQWLADNTMVPAGRIQPFAIDETQISMMVPIHMVDHNILDGLVTIAQKYGLRLAGWRVQANTASKPETLETALWLIIELKP